MSRGIRRDGTFLLGLLKSIKDGPTRELNVATGTAFTFGMNLGGYAIAALAGIVVARALGAHDRGVYSLAVTIPLLFAAFAELGISKAGIYLVGQNKATLQQIASNNFTWFFLISAIWAVFMSILGAVQPAFLPDELGSLHFVVFAIGSALLLMLAFIADLLIASGSIVGYNLVEFSSVALRSILVVGAIAAFAIEIEGVLIVWLVALALASVLALILLATRVSFRLLFNFKIFKLQLSFGLRTYLGYLLQASNHRLDVPLVAAFAGTAALGHYTVAFGMAELLWQLPFALGAVFFPKAASLDLQSNAQAAAVTCRRALFITILGVLGLLIAGRFIIELLYGEQFLPGLSAFYILAPSAIFYTVHKVLSSALAGRGMPEASLYAGVLSFPLTIVLGFLLIPWLGIEGAAIASVCAYAAHALVVLSIFLRVTRQSLWETLLINRADISSSLRGARRLLTTTEPVGAE